VSTTSPTGQEESRLVLPRGVTGFRGCRSETLPETDPRSFATICHEVARATGGRADAITRAGATPNFHSAVIAYGQERVVLLAHQYVPFLATAVPSAGDCA
jgi:hypothetical protein